MIRILMGSLILLLMGQLPTPQYLYRNLEIRSPGYAVTNLKGVDNNLVDWSGGGSQKTSALHYYRSIAIDDELFGGFSVPRIRVGGLCILDSVYLNVYTDGNEDNAWIYIEEIIDGVPTRFDSILFGVGVSGWDTTQVLQNGDYVVKDKYGYRFYLDCTNNGANDIRVECFNKIVYHTDTLQ